MSNVFIDRRKKLLSLKKMREERIEKVSVADKGREIKVCPKCSNEYSRHTLKANLYVCPDCGHHYSIPAKERIRQLVDKDSFVSQNNILESYNPLDFPGYEEKIEEAKKKSGLNEAVVTGYAKIEGIETQLIIMDSRFMMASMGSVVGEKIAQAIEIAIKEYRPVIAVCASGGARMQEGMISLMQMAKTSAAVERLNQKGLLFVTVLTNPTMGGVSASFASLGDIIIAEPQSRIGFAGPRVIEQTINEKLPEGFQSADFMKEHGFVDIVAKRHEIRKLLGNILALHENNDRFLNTTDIKKNNEGSASTVDAIKALSKARDIKRAKTDDYITHLFENFIELSGDRVSGEDTSIIGGIAFYHGVPVTIIGHRKGKDLESNVKYNFGMARPQGYRKAIRLMEQAQKFNRPVITFIDTPGAYPGLDAERDGQSMSIAMSMAKMSSLKVPIISLVIGEGNSGGAIGIAVANSVIMMENAVYSILSPEGFASILWKDSSKWDEACEKMKMTSTDLYELGIIDEVVAEPEDGIREESVEAFKKVDRVLRKHLAKYMDMSANKICKYRYQKYREIGCR